MESLPVQTPDARARGPRHDSILQAATHVIAERGYHKASISDIIARAGIARGTFYLYFSNKRSVFEEILEQAIETLAASILPIEMAGDSPPPRQQLHANLTRVLGLLLRERALSSLLLDNSLSPDPEGQQPLARFFSRVRALIRSSLDTGIAMGLLRPCQTELVAAACLGAVRGVVAQLLEQPETPELGQLVDEIIDFALHGVIARSDAF